MSPALFVDRYVCEIVGGALIGLALWMTTGGSHMDPDSPFAGRESARPIAPSRVVHVNFCSTCHYVWKAPVAATQCVNCTNRDTARSLVSYETEVPVT